MNLIKINDLRKDQIERITDKYTVYQLTRDTRKEVTVGLLFLQPSTRTKYSFIAAANVLDWKYIDFNLNYMATEKGESITDTIRMSLNYVDILVIRSDIKDLVYQAEKIAKDSKYPKVIINAGNGDEEHPTQALIDFYTMRKYFDPKKIKIEYFTLPKYRSRNSLTKLISLFAEKELTDTNIFYIGRGYCGVFSRKRMERVSHGVKIMHPLPRTKELSPCLDDYEHSIYFEQAENAVLVRASLLKYLWEN